MAVESQADTEISQLKKQVETMSNLMQTMLGGMQQLQGQISANQQAPKPPVAQELEISELDLESMPRKQYTDYLISLVSKKLGSEFSNIHTGLRELREKNTEASIKTQVERARAIHPDFDEWQDEMKDLYKTQSSLSIDQLYRLVKSGDPAKVSQLQEKYSPKPKEQPRPALDFGGIMPSQPMTGINPVKMNANDAVLAAFAENSEDLADHFR